MIEGLVEVSVNGCHSGEPGMNSLYLALSEKLNRRTATNYESQTNQVSVSIKESLRVTIVFLFLAPRTVQHAPHNAQILY